MALNRLALEFVLIDGGSAVAKRFAQHIRQLGAEGQAAADHIERMTDRFGDALKAMGTARAMKEMVLDPGLDAARTLEDALKGLEVNLDRASVEDTRKKLQEMALDASRIAEPTKFSQAAIVDIQTELKKAGLAESAIGGKGGAAEAVAQLATAEGKTMTADQALNAVLTLGAKFKLAGDEYAAGADLLARASAASVVDPGEIATALARLSGGGRLDKREVLAALGAAAAQGQQGSEAGTYMSAFLAQAAKNDRKMKLGLFDNGELKSLPEVAEQLRTKFGGMTPQQQSIKLGAAFGEQGRFFAEALMVTGDQSIESMLKGMDSARSLEERMTILSTSLNARTDALAGTGETLLATAFQPALDPLAAAATHLNDAASRLAAYLSGDPNAAKAVSYGTMAGVGGMAAFGGLQLLSSGKSAMEALRSVKTLGGFSRLLGTAGGVAEGKAVEAATGVAPVFVTNWPATMGGLLPGAAAAAGGAGTGILGRLGAVGAAAAVGWETGTAITAAAQGTPIQTALELMMANAVLSTPARVAMSAEDVANTERQRGATWDKLKEQLGLKIDVHVAQDGTSSAQATLDTGEIVRSAQRGPN